MRAEEMIPAARRLELTGMPRSQAETVVCVVQEAVAPLATKADLAASEKQLREDMASLGESLRGEMKDLDRSIRNSVGADLAKMETRLFWKLSGAMLAMSTFMSTFVFAVLRFFPPP